MNDEKDTDTTQESHDSLLHVPNKTKKEQWQPTYCM